MYVVFFSAKTMLRAAVSDGNSFPKDLNKDLRDGLFNLYKGMFVAKNADTTFLIN